MRQNSDPGAALRSRGPQPPERRRSTRGVSPFAGEMFKGRRHDLKEKSPDQLRSGPEVAVWLEMQVSSSCKLACRPSVVHGKTLKRLIRALDR
jgi:hypothetical protein